MNFDYDVIVIGGGHAGIEAALAAARLGHKTAMITMDKNAIGRMSCNPAIGGLAKGQLVREIDVLGGEMGLAIDKTGIQFRILNRSKGPAVQARRAQADRASYSDYMVEICQNQENLDIIEGEASGLLVENKICYGVQLHDGQKVTGKAAVITAGTFLNGLIHIGLEVTPAGRVGEPPSVGLTQSVVEQGITVGRLKTGTPPRLNGDTVDFEKCEIQYGDDPPPYFSNRSDHSRQFEQSTCHLTYTNGTTHRIINENLDKSPLFSGKIQGIGPRYCPSIEDKVIRFADKPRHQLFLEPEGNDINEYYLNGFSSSLPADVQLQAVRTVPGLENVEFTRPGYAIEYDFFPPHQLYITMESKIVENLYFAGQVNGTSGYEEAAAQGLIAGINAVLKIRRKEPFKLSRAESYIGVLLDDLVTKSTEEPYRMFTSRAEYRLHLRDDNADERLLDKGRGIGLVGDHVWKVFENDRKAIEKLNISLRENRIEAVFDDNGTKRRKTVTAHDALKSPAIIWTEYSFYKSLINEYGERLFGKVATEIRYSGYIKRQEAGIERMKSLEDYKIPEKFDYLKMTGLKNEAVEKLITFKPETLGQASRISGITPGDISVLMVYLRRS
jgi:tRNA uridine 5-carboxymethylaminomethyl modification enzyme